MANAQNLMGLGMPGGLANEIASQMGSGGSLGATWRLAANKNWPISYFTAVKQLMSYTVHQARVPMTSLKLVDSNWRFFSGTETANPSSNTIRASLEYPVGSTPVMFTWSGSTTGTNPSGSDLESDELFIGATIPVGGSFVIRKWMSNPTGCNLAQSPAPGDTTTWSGTTVADQTAGGTVAATDATNIGPPSAILSFHNGISVGVVGDSKVFGSNDLTAYNTTTQLRTRGQYNRALWTNYPFVSFGTPGETAAQFTATNAARRIAFINKYCTHVICEHGINGFTTSAAMYTLVQAIWTIFRNLGKKVYAGTLTPNTTGAFVLADGSDQTAAANSAEIVVYNTLLLNQDITDGVVDIASLAQNAADPQKWKAPGYTTDGLHETSLANQIYSRSLVLRPGFLV